MINFEGNNQLNNKITQLSLNKLEKILPNDKIDLMLKKLKARADFEMTDAGTFKPIVESITNHKPVIELGNISLSIKSTSNLNTDFFSPKTDSNTYIKCQTLQLSLR